VPKVARFTVSNVYGPISASQHELDFFLFLLNKTVIQLIGISCIFTLVFFTE